MSAFDPKRTFNVRPILLHPRHVLRGIYNSASFAFAAGFCGIAKDDASVPVNCDLSRGTKRDLIIANVIGNIDDGQRTTSSRPCFRFDERRRSGQLPSRDCRRYDAYLGLEYSARHAVKSDLCIVASHNPLQGILIERRRQRLITLAGIDERHGGSKLRRNDVHTGSQGDLGHKSRPRRTDRGLIEIAQISGNVR
jgi:hypothetical protein